MQGVGQCRLFIEGNVPDNAKHIERWEFTILALVFVFVFFPSGFLSSSIYLGTEAEIVYCWESGCESSTGGHGIRECGVSLQLNLYTHNGPIEDCDITIGSRSKFMRKEDGI